MKSNYIACVSLGSLEIPTMIFIGKPKQNSSQSKHLDLVSPRFDLFYCRRLVETVILLFGYLLLM